MNRSRYYKNKTVEYWEKYRKLRNYCVKLTKKVRRDYFQNLNINSVTDNKTFWRTVKPLFSNKNNKSTKMILLENDEIITDYKKNVEVMNEYFVNIMKNLNIPAYMIEKLPDNINVECIDPIDGIIYNYSKHPSILKINTFVNHRRTF